MAKEPESTYRIRIWRTRVDNYCARVEKKNKLGQWKNCLKSYNMGESYGSTFWGPTRDKALIEAENALNAYKIVSATEVEYVYYD